MRQCYRQALLFWMHASSYPDFLQSMRKKFGCLLSLLLRDRAPSPFESARWPVNPHTPGATNLNIGFMLRASLIRLSNLRNFWKYGNLNFHTIRTSTVSRKLEHDSDDTLAQIRLYRPGNTCVEMCDPWFFGIRIQTCSIKRDPAWSIILKSESKEFLLNAEYPLPLL